MLSWSLPTSHLLLKDHESDENLWWIHDAVDFRAHRRTQIYYAAREGHVAFTTDLLSKLAIATSRRGDASQKTPPLSYEGNYSGGEE